MVEKMARGKCVAAALIAAMLGLVAACGESGEGAQSAATEANVAATQAPEPAPQTTGGQAAAATPDAETPDAETPDAETPDGAQEAAVAGAPVENPFAELGYAIGDIVYGDPDAPVEIIEYASLTCPHCAAFHNGPLQDIKRDYIDTGKAKLIVREVYFDQPGLWASAVARCGGEQRFYAFLDVFYADQSSWAGAAGGRDGIVDEIRKIGRLGGLGSTQVDACLSDRAFLERLASDYLAHAERDGVRSTPTFFINGQEVRGNQDYAFFQEIIDSALGE